MASRLDVDIQDLKDNIGTDRKALNAATDPVERSELRGLITESTKTLNMLLEERRQGKKNSFFNHHNKIKTKLPSFWFYF
jgi:hypothetical protein